jgi:DNA repair protein RecO (recombination protein O)
MIVDTEAIVLRGRDYSDSSRILALYTLSHGRLSVIAKGVKKSAARYGMSLEPMSHLRAVLYVKEQRELQLLSRCEPLDPPGKLLEDMERIAAGLAVVELVAAATPLAEANDAVFRLLASTLQTLRHATNRPRNALYHFEVRLLSELGFQPNFDACASCGTPVDAVVASRKAMRMGHAGVICGSCIDRHHGVFPVSEGALSTLRDFQRMRSPDEAVLRDPGAVLDEEVDAALRRLLQMNIDTLGRLKTRDVFRAVARTADGRQPGG